LVDISGTRGAAAKLRSCVARRIQKLRCGWLPVNVRVARTDPDRLRGCTACSPSGLVEETVDHLFQCTATDRRHAILDRFTSFHSRFREWKTATSLISALQTGAIAWVEGKDLPLVELLSLPDDTLGGLIKRAYNEQSLLGWHVLFRGFWTHSWRLAQEEQFRRYNSRDPEDTGDRWAARAQLWFYELFDHIWGLRNSIEHGADFEIQQLNRRARCERSIRRLYLKGEELSYAERHPFRASLDDLLHKPVTDQEIWIETTEGYLRRAFHRMRARPPGQLALTQFFSRKSQLPGPGS